MTKKEKDKLILEGYSLVVRLHRSFVSTYYLTKYLSKEDIEDMRQDCVIEIIRKINTFDPSRKVKLTTYLTPRIIGFFKDSLIREKQRRQPDLEKLLGSITSSIGVVFESNEKGVSKELERLNITNIDIKNLILDLDCSVEVVGIFESLDDKPDVRMQVILGFYLLNKSIKELSNELGYSTQAGWVYRLKREGIEQLKNILRERGIL